MPYCTLTDLQDQVPAAKLIQLTDDTGAGVVGEAAVAKAIAHADAEIDSYCGGSYDVPFSPVPVIIRKQSVDIAVYNLYARKPGVVPEERQKRYDNAIRFLRDVAAGRVTLGADAPAQENTDNAVALSSGTRIFTRETMRGY
jgi:phage gp36-like protein